MDVLLRILQLLPLIIEAIKAVEKLVSTGKQGPLKLDTVLDIVASNGDDVKELLPALTKTINSVVSLANKTGAFTTTK